MGKRLAASDVILVKGMQKNLEDYRAKHPGEDALWCMSMFSGMPAYTIHVKYEGNITDPVRKALSLGLPDPIGQFFTGMMGMFLLLRVFGCGAWYAAAGGLAFGFFSYHIIITEAGHVNKLAALMYSPAVLASVAFAFRSRPLWGAAFLFLSLSLNINANHQQMTYYLAFVVAAYGVYELARHIAEKKLGRFAMAAGLLILAAGGAVAVNLNRLLPLLEYKQYSIRGPSELKREPGAAKPNTAIDGTGLDRDYAFGWSNDRDEIFTLLVPNLKGGSSNGTLGKNSEIFKLAVGQSGMSEREFRRQKWPLYWGTQAFTSGPAYAGAVVFFLFVVGMLIIPGGLKWALGYVTYLLILLSLGKNSYTLLESAILLALPVGAFYAARKIKAVPTAYTAVAVFVVGYLAVHLISEHPPTGYRLTDFFFEYVPLYNAFRAPSSIVAATDVLFPFAAFLAVKELLNKNRSLAERMHALFAGAGIAALICLILAVAPEFVYDGFESPGDKSFSDNKTFYEALLADRRSLLVSDAFRSLLFILAGAALLWAAMRGTIANANVSGALMAVLVAVDNYGVCARYLPDSEFVSKNEFARSFEPRPADAWIKRNDSSYFRVFPLSRNHWNDGQTPYTLFTIGGYNAAKLKRYQQLGDRYILVERPNFEILNMLNVKYVIFDKNVNLPFWQPLTKQGDEFVYQNLSNFGAAWIVENVKIVPTPDDALNALDTTNLRIAAVVEQKDADKIPADVSQASVNPENEKISVELAENRTMKYRYRSPQKRFVVFSEVYYPKGWRAFIDGKEAPIVQTNFVLRGLTLPAGEHEIVFRYDPEVMQRGKTYSMLASLGLVAFLLAAAGVEYLRRKRTDVRWTRYL
ncbi:MAG: YfhO family protein [Bacteroidia bacterium]|nr:YfhO family protein [Bacteroidia bacterium]